MADEIQNEALEEQPEIDNTSENEVLEQTGFASESPNPASSNVEEPHDSDVNAENHADLNITEISSNIPNNLELLQDVSLDLTVELGRCELQFKEVLQLGIGSIVELNKLADKPVDIYVNQSKIAEGEVVVIGEHYGVRISKLMHPHEKLK